jgi:hypothetical protein
VGELVDIEVGVAAAYLATPYARRLTGSIESMPLLKHSMPQDLIATSPFPAPSRRPLESQGKKSYAIGRESHRQSGTTQGSRPR